MARVSLTLTLTRVGGSFELDRDVYNRLSQKYYINLPPDFWSFWQMYNNAGNDVHKRRIGRDDHRFLPYSRMLLELHVLRKVGA